MGVRLVLAARAVAELALAQVVLVQPTKDMQVVTGLMLALVMLQVEAGAGQEQSVEHLALQKLVVSV